MQGPDYRETHEFAFQPNQETAVYITTPRGSPVQRQSLQTVHNHVRTLPAQQGKHIGKVTGHLPTMRYNRRPVRTTATAW